MIGSAPLISQKTAGELRFLVGFQLLVCLCGAALIGGFQDEIAAASFAVGAFLMFVNLLFQTLVWPWILVKKQVALSVGVIVFKFAMLGWIVYEVAFTNRFARLFGDQLNLGWFAVGLATLVVTVFATALRVSLKSREKVVS